MKVLLFSISLEGGAGGATHRLHQGLKRIGVSSQVMVRKKITDDAAEILVPRTWLGEKLARFRPRIDKLPLKRYSAKRKGLFFPQWLPDFSSSWVAQFRPDVINLHWVLDGYISIEAIPKLNKPIVWSLHDMWAFTGGCVYSQDCDRYTDACGACPIFKSDKDRDLSRWVWQRKANAWKNLDFTVVTPSSWLAECARFSSLFKGRRVEVIPWGLDTEKFKPVNQKTAREILNLPQDKQIVLFGVWKNDPRKGLHLLHAALKSLSRAGWGNKLELAVFGFSGSLDQGDLGFKSHNLGRFHDNLSLSVVYSAADVMVVPSIQEAFGQTASEALACGTPVVVFDGTGLKDIVDHQQNGYVAKPYETEDLAKGIAWVLEDGERRQHLARCAREKAEREFDLEQQAQQYLTLFNEVVERHNRSMHTKRL